jgi:hypothetical protein
MKQNPEETVQTCSTSVRYFDYQSCSEGVDNINQTEVRNNLIINDSSRHILIVSATIYRIYKLSASHPKLGKHIFLPV